MYKIRLRKLRRVLVLTCNATAELSECQNGGSCSETDGEHVCHCAPGYSGALCELEVDECLPESCLNGGSCVDLLDSFSCSCPESFAGPRCDGRYIVC